MTLGVEPTRPDIGYGYIGSWALLTACEERVFDRLPARVEGLADTLQAQAPGWEPYEDARRWRDGLDL